MKMRLRIRVGTEVREELHDVSGDTPSKALRAAEALVKERNQHLPQEQREVLLGALPVHGRL